MAVLLRGIIPNYVVEHEADKIGLTTQDFTTCYVKDTKITYAYDATISDWIAIPTATISLSKTKAADQSVTNSTVLVDDTDLFFPMLAGETYRFDIILFIKNASAVPDIRFQIHSTGATVDVRYQCEIWKDDAGIQLLDHTINSAFDTLFQPNWATAPDTYCRLQGTVTNNGSNSIFKLQWAQRVSNATATVVKRGSSLNIVKLIT